MQVAVACFAFVGVFGSGASPRPIEMKRFAFLAITSGCVVATVAAEMSVSSLDAARGVTVAFASSANGEIRRRVEGIVANGDGSGRPVVVVRASAAALVVLSVRVEAMEDDADIGGRHPVLQDGTVLEIESARPALHRAESDARSGQRIE